jgi:hypothetical protein
VDDPSTFVKAIHYLYSKPGFQHQPSKRSRPDLAAMVQALCFGDNLGELFPQRSSDAAGGSQAGDSHTSFNESDIGGMEVGLFSQSLLREFQGKSVLPDYFAKGLGNSGLRHSPQHPKAGSGSSTDNSLYMLLSVFVNGGSDEGASLRLPLLSGALY